MGLLTRRLIGQSLVTLLVAAVFAYQVSWLAALAALYGGMVALVNSGLFAWRIHQARQDVAQTAYADAFLLMVSLFERLAWVAVSLAVGMGVLELPPLGIVVAFSAAQLVLLAIRAKL